MCSYSTSLLFIQSIIISLCLPQVLDPSILPPKTVHRRDSLLNTWSNQCFCLCQMVFIELLFSSTMSKTSWLDRCSVQLIFINLLQIHISNDSSRWMSTFFNVHVSAAYSRPTVLHTRVFTILFFNSNFIFPLSTSPRLLNASFPMAIRHFTSSWHLQSSVITLPNTQTVALVTLCGRLSWSSFSVLQFSWWGYLTVKKLRICVTFMSEVKSEYQNLWYFNSMDQNKTLYYK